MQIYVLLPLLRSACPKSGLDALMHHHVQNAWDLPFDLYHSTLLSGVKICCLYLAVIFVDELAGIETATYVEQWRRQVVLSRLHWHLDVLVELSKPQTL